MNDLMQHAMNVGGFCKPLKRLPSAGSTIVKVEWNGCMATTRCEVDIGDIIRYEAKQIYGSSKPVDGIIIQWDKRGERWEPLDHLRLVNGAAEIWE